MSNPKRVEVAIKHSVAYVTLARPDKHNALDMPMFEAIVAAAKSLRRNRGIRAVIVSGEGPDFCTGLDVKSMMKSAKSPMKLLFKLNPWRSNTAQKVSTQWQKVGAPVITVIHGRCWGGGLHIALGADIRIATPDATLSIMEGRWGMIPDMGGLLALRQHCRMDVAKELTMTARVIDAAEAQAAGLISHISEDPMAQAEALAAELVTQSPDSLAAVKKLYNKSWFGGRGSVLMRETWYQLRVLFGKNRAIKTFNQTHDAERHKHFIPRKKW